MQKESDAMGESLAQLWENLIGRASGPMNLRLLLQPAVAAFFGIRAGLRDAREGRKPYGWTLRRIEVADK
jgi:hypothetical protein